MYLYFPSQGACPTLGHAHACLIYSLIQIYAVMQETFRDLTPSSEHDAALRHNSHEAIVMHCMRGYNQSHGDHRASNLSS